MRNRATGDPTESLGVDAALVRLSFLVQSIYGEVATSYGLTPAQAQLLCVVKDVPRGMGELGHMLRLEKASLSGLVDRAERRGLIRRLPSPHDGRAVTIEMTRRGKPIIEGFFDDVSTRLVEIVATLSDADRERFTQLASVIVVSEAVPPVFSGGVHAQ